MEFISLQFGPYSNYLGSHYWNLQDSQEQKNNNLFRTGITKYNEETRTPRVLCFDNKGSLNNMPSNGFIYNDFDPRINKLSKQNQTKKDPDKYSNFQIISQTEITNEDDFIPTWDGKIEMIEFEKPRQKNWYLRSFEEDTEPNKIEQDGYFGEKDNQPKMNERTDQEKKEKNKIEPELPPLDDMVEFWSDFLGVELHPKSIFELSNFRRESNPLECFFEGEKAFNGNTYQEDEITDRFRFFLEESDALQGIYASVDHLNGFAGFANAFFDYLNGECPKIKKIVFATSPNSLSNLDQISNDAFILNSALSLMNIVEKCHIYVPLEVEDQTKKQAKFTTNSNQKNESSQINFPLLKYNGSNYYQTSSILASYLVNLLGPHQVMNTRFSIHDLTKLVNIRASMKLASAFACFPLPLIEDRGYFQGSQKIYMDSSFKSVFSETESLYSPQNPLFTSPLSPLYQPFDFSLLYSEYFVIRGVELEHQFSNKPNEPKQNTSDFISDFLSKTRAISRTYDVISSPLKTSGSFPRIFTSEVNENGVKIYPQQKNSILLPKENKNNSHLNQLIQQIQQEETKREISNQSSARFPRNTHVQQFPLFSTLTSSRSISSFLRSFTDRFMRIRTELFPEFVHNGLDSDAKLEIQNSLLTLADNYED